MPELTTAGEESHRFVILPPRKWVPIDFHEVWNHRELLYFFVWRDVKIRYKQTALGFSWAILQPLFMMIIFTIFFGGLANIPSEGIPYPVFALAGVMPWTLFAEGLSRSTSSMVSNAHIMTKVYFPRLLLPISGILSPLVDFFVAFSLLIITMIFFGVAPTWNILFLPAFIVLAVATSLGVGLWFSALNVKYRDFGYTIPFIIQIWLFASPVVYPSTMIPLPYRVLYGLNPMAGVIEGSRWALVGTDPPSLMIFVSVGVVIALLISGMFYFRKMEQYFADII
jgi:lipopolysaccharide transport system permease protein